MEYYFQGLLMGLASVMPIGMQNMFVINGSLTSSKRKAFLKTWIVILFDLSLGFASFFGIGGIFQKWEWLQTVVLGVGSIFVILIGVSLIRTKGQRLETDDRETSLKQTFVSAFVVTWCNPQAILDASMILGSFRISMPAEAGRFFILGVFTASMLWFNTLNFVISRFRDKINEKVLRVINIVCGLVIIGYGVKLIMNFISMVNG